MNIIETKGITPVFENSGMMVESGMNLIEYFAAHAPAVPDWFEPQLPEKPQPPEHYEMILNPVQLDIVKKAWSDDNDDWYEENDVRVTKEIDRVMKSWVKQWKEFRAESRQWEEDKQIQTLMQWPFYYASQVLKNYIEKYINY